MKIKFRSPFTFELDKNKRILALEKEKDALEGEINALNKEHENIIDQLKQLKRSISNDKQSEVEDAKEEGE